MGNDQGSQAPPQTLALLAFSPGTAVPLPLGAQAETLGTIAAGPELPLLCMMGSRECEAGSSGVILEEILKARAIKAGGWAVSDVIEI